MIYSMMHAYSGMVYSFYLAQFPCRSVVECLTETY
jgi:hypothetical protein